MLRGNRLINAFGVRNRYLSLFNDRIPWESEVDRYNKKEDLFFPEEGEEGVEKGSKKLNQK